MPSQFGQDRIVLELLDGKRGGFFLDSGAADGIRSSNTYLLEQSFDWCGICIEPNSKLFSALKANRRCICLNHCLYYYDGYVDFVESAMQLGGILIEYHPKLLRHAINTRPTDFDESGRVVTVAKMSRTIRSVLKDCDAPSVLDYWSLDTEGSELKLLKSFPFDEYSFRVLTVEHNNLPVRTEIRQFLEGIGYRYVRSLGIDDCYIRSPEVSFHPPDVRTRS